MGIWDTIARSARMINHDPKMAMNDLGQKGIAFGTRRMSKTLGMNSFRGDGTKMWGMGAVKAAGINAGIGGVYGATTADDYDRAGGAFRGAVGGVGLGLAGRGALSIAKRSPAASRWINTKFDQTMEKGTNQFNKMYERKTGSANWNAFQTLERGRVLQSMGRKAQGKVNKTGPYNFTGPINNRNMYG